MLNIKLFKNKDCQEISTDVGWNQVVQKFERKEKELVG